MRHSHLLLLPLLLFAGCSSQQYASKLHLPTLAAPEKLAPVEGVDLKTMGPLFSSIEDAKTPADADSVTGQIQRSGAFMASLSSASGPTDTAEVKANRKVWFDEFAHTVAFLEQAGKIKSAQLADGDSHDGSREVGERLDNARQCVANLAQIDKDKPSGTSAQNMTSFSQSFGTGGAGPLLDTERVWVRNCHEAWDMLTPVTTEKSTAAVYLRTRDEWTAAKAHYDGMIVPTRFTKAGECFKQAFDNAIGSIDAYGQYRIGEREELFDQASALARDYDTMRGKGFDEVKAAGGW